MKNREETKEAWTPAVVVLMKSMYQAVIAGEKIEDLTEALERGANNAIHERNKHQMPQQPHMNVLLQRVAVKTDPDAKKLPTPEWSKDLMWTSGHPFTTTTSDDIRLTLIEYVPPASVLNDARVCVEAEWQGNAPNHPSFCRKASGSRVEVLVDGLLVQARAHIKMVTDELKRRGDVRP